MDFTGGPLDIPNWISRNMKPSKYLAEIDEGELAIRMAEAALRIKRAPGKNTEETLASFPADWGQAFLDSARAAMEYWKECLEKAKTPS